MVTKHSVNKILFVHKGGVWLEPCVKEVIHTRVLLYPTGVVRRDISWKFYY